MVQKKRPDTLSQAWVWVPVLLFSISVMLRQLFNLLETQFLLFSENNHT